VFFSLQKVSKANLLCATGAVLNRKFVCYEAHLNFIMQLMARPCECPLLRRHETLLCRHKALRRSSGNFCLSDPVLSFLKQLLCQPNTLSD
jgi:hypothetical protein